MAKASALTMPVALLALLAAPLCRADIKFRPSVDLRETYTDNIGLTNDANKQSRFVTEVAPGFNLSSRSRRIKLNADYRFHYYAYDDKGIEGARHAHSQLNADVDAELIDDLLYFDGSASIGQQPVNAFGPAINQNAYAGANTSNVKAYSLSPYLRKRFGSFASAQLRYTRDHVDTGLPVIGETTGDFLRLNVASGQAFRTVGWGFSASRSRLDERSDFPTTNVKNISANVSYRVTGELALTLAGGHDEYDYQSIEGPTKGKFHQVGFEWVPGPRTSVTASAGRRYYGDSYFLQALHRSRRSVWSINYNDSVTTSRAQYLLPATIDTASMLDKLFMPDIADPAMRRLAVDAYIRATGLPAALADNINFFSNRYVLQKQLQASVAYSTAKTTTVLSVFDMRNDALSSTQTDSPLTGSGSSTLNVNTRQRGASALWNWRLNSRSGVNVSLTSARVASLSQPGLTSTNRAIRVGATRQIGRKLRGAVEARRVSGLAALGAGTYRENAVSASLSLLF